jgi:hypothetical protein
MASLFDQIKDEEPEALKGNLFQQAGVADDSFVPIGDIPGDYPEGVMPEDYIPEPIPTLDEKARANTLGALDFGVTSLLSAIPATGASVLGFLEGVAEEIAGGEFGSYEAAERIRQKSMQRAQDVSLQPFTESGRQTQEAVGEALTETPLGRAVASSGIATAPLAAATAPLIKGATVSNPVRNYLASKRLIDEKSGLPVGPLKKSLKKYGAGVELIDDTADIDRLLEDHGVDGAVEIAARRKISRGEDNAVLAGLKLENNSLVKDKLGEKAVNQGFRSGDVAMSKNSNMQTRKAMLDMLKDKRKLVRESSYNRRPIDKVGEVMVERVGILNNRASELRKKLDSIARGSVDERALPGPGVTRGLKGLDVDSSGVERAVMEGLDSLDLDIPDEVRRNTTLLNDFLKDKNAFVASAISEDSGSKSLIRKTVKLLNEARTADAYELHKIKRQIDSMLDWESTKYKGLKGEGEKFAKNVRFQVNQAIRDVNPTYAAVNDELSGIAGALGKFRKALGEKRIDWRSDSVSSAVGQEMRKLETNYGVKQALSDSAKAIDDQVRKLGIDTPVDADRLVRFSYVLDERFRPSARGSFSGSIAGTLSGEIAAGQSAQNVGLGLIRKGIEKLRSVSDEDAMNTMQQILTRDQL